MFVSSICLVFTFLGYQPVTQTTFQETLPFVFIFSPYQERGKRFQIAFCACQDSSIHLTRVNRLIDNTSMPLLCFFLPGVLSFMGWIRYNFHRQNVCVVSAFRTHKHIQIHTHTHKQQSLIKYERENIKDNRAILSYNGLTLWSQNSLMLLNIEDFKELLFMWIVYQQLPYWKI